MQSQAVEGAGDFASLLRTRSVQLANRMAMKCSRIVFVDACIHGKVLVTEQAQSLIKPRQTQTWTANTSSAAGAVEAAFKL